MVDCADLARPRLVPTTGERSDYIALSYVWGEDQAHKTTKGNLSAYEQGIDLSCLPATIHDAIYVTHMLGFRWLWVDSLCILQDSDEDKAHEIGRMHLIYRYAHVTIMAGSANGASSGFLQKRPPEDDLALPFICPPTFVDCRDELSVAQIQVGQVHLVSWWGQMYQKDLGRMATRAWCMQEYLSTLR